MPYDDDEAKRAARTRLEQRMSRRGSAIDARRASSAPSRRGEEAPPSTVRPSGPVTLMAILAVLAAIILAVAVSRCSASDQPEPEEAEAVQVAPSRADEAADDAQAAQAGDAADVAALDEEAQEELVELIGEEEAGKLVEAAKSDEDALWIAAHADNYDLDGPEVQAKILKLAADEPTARRYVKSFVSEYPLSEAIDDTSLAMETGSPSADVPDTNVPHLYQWDRRWGNTVYSSAAFGLTGCGPTSYAMAYQGVTGKADIDPCEMGKIADERGYMSEFNGTSNAFFGDMAEEFGMSCEELDATSENLVDALTSGHVVIAHLGPGLFTTRGHYFVLAGVADNGEVILNDPYSHERSSRTWPADTIAGEATEYYSFAALD